MASKKKSRKPAFRKPKAFDLKAWLTNKLRRISYQFPARKEVIQKARTARGIYKCHSCEGEFNRKFIQLDHATPVIDPHEGFVDWNTYIERLFCDASGWHCLCIQCHETKTYQENLVRKAVKESK